MKLRKFALTVLILTVLFTNGMQCRDSQEERRLRRNERREVKKLKRLERSRRLRNHNRERVVTATEGVFYPEIVDITPVPPLEVHPQSPEEVIRQATRIQQQMAAQSRLQNQQGHHENMNEQMTTTTSHEESTTTVDNSDYEMNNVNMTWSGDHDLMSINGTYNDSYLFDDYNSTLSNETLVNGTNGNITSTPTPPRTTPDPNKLDIWRIKQRNKMMRIMMIQTQILQRLGFQKQPNVSATISKEDRIIYEHIFQQMKSNDEDKGRELYEDDYNAKRYFWHLPSCETPRRSDSSWTTDGDLFRMYFELKLPEERLMEETKVSSATLSLYKKSFTDNEPEESDSEDENEEDEDDEDIDSDDRIRVTLYQYTKPVKRKRKGSGIQEKRSALETILVTKRQEGWIKFHIGNVVANWLKHPTKNFGLVIIAEDGGHAEGTQPRLLNANLLFDNYNCSVNQNQSHVPVPFPLALPGSSVTERNRTSHHLHANQTHPYLEVIMKDVPTEDKNTPRFRRDLSKRKSKGCVRQEMYVSFAELGWSDWIIQPLGFDAGYCKGTCSSVVDDASGSLKIKHFTSKLPDGIEFTQFECCGPSKLKPLQILHQDQNGKMAVSIFDDFIITQCGCRP